MSKKSLLLILLIALGVYFAYGKISFYQSPAQNQVTESEPTVVPFRIVSSVDLLRSAEPFVDFLSNSKLNVAAVYCSSATECSSAEEGSAGGVSWRVLANAVLYGLDKKPERLTLLEQDFKILGGLDPGLPIVTAFGVYEAYRLTQERKYGGYVFLVGSKTSSELSTQTEIKSYGSMLDGMLGMQLINAYKVINDPKYQEYLVADKLNLDSFKETNKRLVAQALRMKALLGKSSDPSLQYAPSQTPGGQGDLSSEWITARCWYAAVAAGLYEITGNTEHAEDVSKMLSGIRTDTKAELSRKGTNPNFYAPCVDAAQTLALAVKNAEKAGKDVRGVPQPFIMNEIADLLIQEAILPAFDTSHRPLCEGTGAVFGGWSKENNDEKGEACRSAARSIADTAYSILLLSRSTGKFKL